MKSRVEMSETRLRVFAVIGELIAEYGHAPTFREIGRRAGLDSSSTVSAHVKALKKAGLVDYVDGLPRTIRIIDKPSQETSGEAA